jgi:hypothetical protein
VLVRAVFSQVRDEHKTEHDAIVPELTSEIAKLETEAAERDLANSREKVGAVGVAVTACRAIVTHNVGARRTR